MTARMRRLASDFEQVKKDFTNHQNIMIQPVGSEPPEQYNVTYFVNGLYMLPDGKIETLARHEVEITLHAEYPRYKPICKIKTPIWHPNFRDGQVCIGDIWGAGESLSDIIINIGDMIQYKSWNAYSPLSSEAAKWAIENKHMLPVGNANLYKADYSGAKEEFDIDLFDEGEIEEMVEVAVEEPTPTPLPASPLPSFDLAPRTNDGNDFDITAEDLANIEFVPTAQRMQTVSSGGFVKGKKVNFKTVLVKGIIWAFIGAFLGFGLSELLSDATSTAQVLRMEGHKEVGDLMAAFDHLDKDTDYADYVELQQQFDKLGLSEDELSALAGSATRTSTGFFAAFIALGIGLFLGIGEGVYYGSKEKAMQYALIGAGVSLGIGFVSGYIAQALYGAFSSSTQTGFSAALVRGFGWAIMGVGIGLAVGLIKPEKKRVIFCAIGGLAGAFVGGFLFNYICDALSAGSSNDGVVARGVAIVIMGLLIGLGVGLLEQFAKAAWLKVIRGEFEGKEYLVFAGTTSIGNNGKNTIVLFKDKLVGPNHCDIVLEGSKYVLTDKGTPMGTVVNGQRIMRHVLKQGDTIAVGNSVLVFNTK